MAFRSHNDLEVDDHHPHKSDVAGKIEAFEPVAFRGLRGGVHRHPLFRCRGIRRWDCGVRPHRLMGFLRIPG